MKTKEAWPAGADHASGFVTRWTRSRRVARLGHGGAIARAGGGVRDDLGVEGEVLLLVALGLDANLHVVLAAEVAAEDLLAERVLDELLDRPAEWTRAEVGA